MEENATQLGGMGSWVLYTEFTNDISTCYRWFDLYVELFMTEAGSREAFLVCAQYCIHVEA